MKNGKQQKRWVLTILTVLIAVLTMLTLSAAPAQAAVKNGLVKKGGKIYYYKNGRKVTNAWKTLKDGDKKYRFYFRSKGSACKAAQATELSVNEQGDLVDIVKYNVKIFTISGKKYGFDSNGHRVQKGAYVDKNAKLYVFKKNGVYNASKTTSYRKQFKYYNKGGRRSTELKKEITKAFGKPVSTKIVKEVCASWDGLPFSEFHIETLTYPYFTVQLLCRTATGEYGVVNFTSNEMK